MWSIDNLIESGDIVKLQNLIEDMKCCGNCGLALVCQDKKCPKGYCSTYTFDMLPQEMRKEKNK